MFSLKNRSLLTLMNYSQEEISFLLELAAKLKKEKHSGIEKQMLKGKNIALIFEKDSTRTRCAFEVSASDQGAHSTYLASGSHIIREESAEDTARVLGRMYDGIEYRGFKQTTVEILSEYAGVPVWNGLTNEDHPTQVLADLLTIMEHCDKPLSQVKLVYVGDGRNNMANALMMGAVKMGMEIRIVSPKELFPDESLVKKCKTVAAENKANIVITDNVDEGVKNADVIYTDVWLSMGEPDELWESRINLLMPYQVNMDMIKKTNNDNVKFFHCLPSFHNTSTDIGKKLFKQFGLEALEVTDEVFESKYSVVFDEAENRMHTIKAVMVATLVD